MVHFYRTATIAYSLECILAAASPSSVESEWGTYWLESWAWSVPLIVLTVLIHTYALFMPRHKIIVALSNYYENEKFKGPFSLLMGATILLVTVMLVVEAALWAGAYVLLGAIPDLKSALLYSLEAMTTFGHADVFLASHWRMMGALEALNGVILFGLSTAYLFSLIQGVYEQQKSER